MRFLSIHASYGFGTQSLLLNKVSTFSNFDLIKSKFTEENDQTEYE